MSLQRKAAAKMLHSLTEKMVERAEQIREYAPAASIRLKSEAQYFDEVARNILLDNVRGHRIVGFPAKTFL